MTWVRTNYMKINSLNSTNSINAQAKQPNFNGKLANQAVNFISKHPMFVTGLAGSSVIAQKIVMSGSEATIGPLMDIAIGKGITKITNEQDDRTNQSSKIQAIRTCSQSVGGTITGVLIRAACIFGSTALLMKAGQKAGGKIAEIINPTKISKAVDEYHYVKNAENWGKTVGGALAIAVMMFTNFVIDAPFINAINKKMTSFIDGLAKDKSKTIQAPEKAETSKDTKQESKEGING